MKKLLISLIKFYRKFISPGKAPCCKFRPTCSQYALDAINKYGAFKGGIMAGYRILRCHPFSKFNVSSNSGFYEKHI